MNKRLISSAILSVFAVTANAGTLDFSQDSVATEKVVAEAPQVASEPAEPVPAAAPEVLVVDASVKNEVVEPSKKGVFGHPDVLQVGLGFNLAKDHRSSRHTDEITLRVRSDIDNITSSFGFETNTESMYSVIQVGHFERQVEPYTLGWAGTNTVTNYSPGSKYFGLGAGFKSDGPFYMFGEMTANYLFNPERRQIHWENRWCEQFNGQINCNSDLYQDENPEPLFTTRLMIESLIGAGYSFDNGIDVKMGWIYKMALNHTVFGGLSDLNMEIAFNF